jgi:hypothetical protein
MSPKDRGKEPPTTNFNVRTVLNSPLCAQSISAQITPHCDRSCSRYCSGINNQLEVVEGEQRIYLKQGATVQTSYVLIDITNPTDLIKTGRVSIGRPNKD